VYVERGHLIVEDGIADERRRTRFNRATSGLSRLVVVAHTGFVTLEALRWLDDIGAAFVQIDADGKVIASSAPARHHDARLRRAQVLAADATSGRTIMVELLRTKLERQAQIADQLSHLRAHARKNGDGVSVAEAIRAVAQQLIPRLSYARLRALEAIAGRYYWTTWALVPVQFAGSWGERVPEHWRTAGPRTSPIDKKMPRRAATPVHAMLNYGYAILEAEAILACHAAGLDPALGLMHTDARYRGSLATDLMEPVRPVVDAYVLGLIEGRRLGRREVTETPEGVCRIGPPVAQELAMQAPTLRAALKLQARDLTKALIAGFTR